MSKKTSVTGKKVEEDEHGNIKLGKHSVKRGQRFGPLTVVKLQYKGEALVDCLCDCGKMMPCSVEGLILGLFSEVGCPHIKTDPSKGPHAAHGNEIVHLPAVLDQSLGPKAESALLDVFSE